MDWIKQNYDRFLLGLAALVLAVCAGILFNNARSFTDTFQSLKGQVSKSTKIPAVDTESVNKEIQQISNNASNPDLWQPRMVGDGQLPVFVSTPYISKIEPDPATGQPHEVLINPLDGNLDQQIHPPVPNKWLIDNKQDLLAQNVLSQDTDGDGFNTLDEFNGKTDPQNKDDHPPYYTKLFMKQFVRVPFRLLFAARNGQTVLLNTLDDPDAPTLFLTVGKMVGTTKFKVIKLDVKTAKVNGIDKDVSELTLQNIDTKETIKMVKEQVVDSPTTYAQMTYLWKGKDFPLKKTQEFTLEPQDNVRYRCLDMNDNGVTVLKLDENKTLQIPKLPKQP